MRRCRQCRDRDRHPSALSLQRIEKAAHVVGDFGSVRFQRKMSGVGQNMGFDGLEVALLGFCARHAEHEIAFSPDDQRRRLVAPEVLVPICISPVLMPPTAVRLSVPRIDNTSGSAQRLLLTARSRSRRVASLDRPLTSPRP
jgi:hypothetical protein